jgi:gentisate 1,2-dioxygenase
MPDGLRTLMMTHLSTNYAPVRSQFWRIEDLTTEVLEALATDLCGNARIIEGRALAVKASPAHGSATEITLGMAALPPGFSRSAHAHAAEEVAMVLSGKGAAIVEGRRRQLRAGSLWLTPPWTQHAIEASHSGPLVVLWLYAPSGSEAEWVQLGGHRSRSSTGQA